MEESLKDDRNEGSHARWPEGQEKVDESSAEEGSRSTSPINE